MIGYSWIVLEVGKRRINIRELVDGEQLLSAERREDALLFEWVRDITDFEPKDSEGSEEVLELLGGELLGFHKDKRGVLLLPVRGMETPNGPYAKLVAKHAATGVWLENLSSEPGADPVRDMRAEIDLPNVPRSKQVEIYVMSPARAVRELGAVAPIRAICMDRISQLTPKEVSGFYLPELRNRGVKAKRRVWSDGSAEQLVAQLGDRKIMIHAEVSDGGTFVRVASIFER